MDQTRQGGEAEVRFKRISTGFVFRAPKPWPFAPARHFLVTADQKAQIVSVLRRTPGQIIAMVAFIVIAVAVAFPLAGWSERIAANIYFGLIALGVAGLFMQDWWRVRPLIAGLPPTNQRITLLERTRTRAAISPLGLLVFWDILVGYWLLRASMDLHAAMTSASSHAWSNPWPWPPVIVLAWALVYVLILTILRINMRSDRTTAA